MNDILVRKQARAVRTNEYLILRGERDWSGAPVIGALWVRAIRHNNHGTHGTVTFRVTPGWGCVRRRPGGWRAVARSTTLEITVDRSQIMTRYSGNLPPPLWMLTELP